MTEPPTSSDRIWEGARKLFQEAPPEMQARVKKLPLEWHISRLIIALTPAVLFVIVMERVKKNLVKKDKPPPKRPKRGDKQTQPEPDSVEQKTLATTALEQRIRALEARMDTFVTLEPTSVAATPSNDSLTDATNDTITSPEARGTSRLSTDMSAATKTAGILQDDGHLSSATVPNDPWRYNPKRTWTAWIQAITNPQDSQN
eukprot:m.258364 g.258364  ORF g.258364 m.258364 type:complete len:202 (+) comp17584_c0_seq19:44-649(+)